MDLSIVIVNYNVRYFLEQCLYSVARAIKNIKAEVFVVDNNSVDGSTLMVLQKFPWVTLIENQVNVGFSRANNQAIPLANGQFILLLNPDTIVEEGSFTKCLGFMHHHPEAGALGVKMIDGRGNFLPESKRSLPTPRVAFYKVFGLASLFPRSAAFGRYHLGNLDKDEIHQVEILSGAYMFIRKEALGKTGILDESFFMYGEDIDLSYRITQAGYKNYYFPETTIIHYKGESTKKGSINYVLVFYKAMIIFAKKHFSRKKARSLSLLINFAIYLRASISIIKRSLQKIVQPLIDFLLIYLGFYFFTPVWSGLKFGMEDHFPPFYLQFMVPIYILIFITSVYYSGGYEKPVKIWNIFKGYLSGTIFLLVLYALLPEDLRFSRALILMGSFWAIAVLLFHRFIMNLTGIRDYEFSLNRKKRVLLIAGKDESERVGRILKNTRLSPDIVGTVNPAGSQDPFFIGNITQIQEIVRIHKIEEVVFCSRDIAAQGIIKNMALLNDENIEFKIAPPESLSVIGSNSIYTSGDLYLIRFNSIGKENNKRKKRLFDVLVSLVMILLSPILWIFIKDFPRVLKSALLVFAGNLTWVGYCPKTDLSSIPVLRPGVYSVCLKEQEELPQTVSENLNLEYARDYHISADFNILWMNLFFIKKK